MPLNEVKVRSDLLPEFNQTAYDLPKTRFVGRLQYFFSELGDGLTTHTVLDTFKKMGLFIPETPDEFLRGTDGVLVFLNRFGIVIRVEYKNTRDPHSVTTSDRISISPWILEPLASIDAGGAIIELCPGCLLETDKEKSKFLYKQLKKQNIKFWDHTISNSGLVPIRTPLFPEGIPVVIDRGAVRELTGGLSYVRTLLGIFKSKKAREAATVQEELYKPLRDAFDEAWPDKSELPDTLKMKRFWNLCESYTKEGKLAAGWKDGIYTIDSYYKQEEAKNVAAAYETRLGSAEQTINPTAAAVPQLLCQPV